MPGRVSPQTNHVEHSALHVFEMLAKQLFDLREVLRVVVVLVGSHHLQVTHGRIDFGNCGNAFREQVAVSVEHRFLLILLYRLRLPQLTVMLTMSTSS